MRRKNVDEAHILLADLEIDALDSYRLLNDLDDDDCIDCGAHEEQACEFDCLTRHLATQEDLHETSD